ncbi:MAG: flavodoxin family protein [Oscillospiraceae bacterium]|jgi:multimeric flavodoxin WrbA|nr:flavodoxin family protein [Oscillospiraceae bacterium]
MINHKQALALFGSPHKNGFTALVYNYFLERLTKYDIKKINAFESNFRPCVDCKICKKSNSCAFDDMNQFDPVFRSSSLLIIASPLYNFSFPAPLKAIIDRFQRYYCEKYYLKNELQKKTAVLILTCGRENNDKWIEIFKNQITVFLKSIDINLAHTICLKSTDNLKSGVDNLPQNVKMDINNIVKII